MSVEWAAHVLPCARDVLLLPMVFNATTAACQIPLICKSSDGDRLTALARLPKQSIRTLPVGLVSARGIAENKICSATSQEAIVSGPPSWNLAIGRLGVPGWGEREKLIAIFSNSERVLILRGK